MTNMAGDNGVVEGGVGGGVVAAEHGVITFGQLLSARVS